MKIQSPAFNGVAAGAVSNPWFGTREKLVGSLALLFAVVCLGLNLQWGYTGLFNIGVSGFYLVGAYAFALLCGPPHAGIVGGLQLPFLVGLVGSMVAAGAVAFVVGIPTLRRM